MSKVFNYNSSKFVLTCGGYEISGFAKEESVTFRHIEDRYTYVAGIEEGVRVKNPNNHGEIVINLLKTSESNSVLSKFYSDDVETDRAYFVLSFSEKNRDDGLDNFSASAPVCWIMKNPDVVYSADADVIRWTLQTGNLQYGHKRNVSVAQSPSPTTTTPNP